MAMKSKLLHIIVLVGICLTFFSCSDDTEPEPKHYENVAIIYWMGDNSLSSWAEADIKELVAGKDDIPDSSTIIIYVDLANTTPIIYQLDRKEGLKVWKQYTVEEDCTDSLTLLNNFRTIIKNFPANNYGLTFGSHGSGWVIHQRRALGPDQSHSGNYLNIPTLRRILEKLPHMRYIFFDVCFMQSIEVAYELRKQADWIIGSPAEIPSPGAPYNLLTKALCEGDASAIVNEYDGYYPIGNYFGTLLSAIKCNELESFAAATYPYIINAFAEEQTITSNQAQVIQKYSSQFPLYTYAYDMNSAMAHILSEEDYNEWVMAFEKAVPIHKYNSGRWTSSWYLNQRICNNPTIYDSKHFGGVTMYIPQEGLEGDIKNDDLKKYQWYKDAGWEQTGW